MINMKTKMKYEKNKLENEKILLSNLIELGNPTHILKEVRIIISPLIPEFDFKAFNHIFYDIIRLFRGKFPGYQKCNTDYHDINHTTKSLITMARLIHGYILKNKNLSERDVFLGLVSALMHDTGYIQTLDDNIGTGAKYTLQHISRSILFLEKYFEKNDYSKEDFEFCKNCLLCTGYSIKIKEINFSSPNEELVGKMLGTADLLGQMADRGYLEKLLFLYYEFKEGNVLDFKSELDMLKKTLDFYDLTKKRFVSELGNLNKYMIYHFKERWNINKDLYQEEIEKNIEYLKYILNKNEKNYYTHLRRGGIVKKLNKVKIQLNY